MWPGGTLVTSNDPLSYEWHQQSTGLLWRSLTNGHNCSDEDDSCDVQRTLQQETDICLCIFANRYPVLHAGLDNAWINTSFSGPVGTLVYLTVCAHSEHCSGGVRERSLLTSALSLW